MFLWIMAVSNCSLSSVAILEIHTLIFAVASLHFFMHSLLYLSFQNSSSRRLIKAGCLEDVRCIDPVVASPSHHTVTIDFEFVHRDLERPR